MSSEIKYIFIPRAAKSLYFEAMKASKPNNQERRGKEGVGEEGKEKREKKRERRKERKRNSEGKAKSSTEFSAIALGVLLFPIGIIGCCMLKVNQQNTIHQTHMFALS